MWTPWTQIILQGLPPLPLKTSTAEEPSWSLPAQRGAGAQGGTPTKCVLGARGSEPLSFPPQAAPLYALPCHAQSFDNVGAVYIKTIMIIHNGELAEQVLPSEELVCPPHLGPLGRLALARVWATRRKPGPNQQHPEAIEQVARCLWESGLSAQAALPIFSKQTGQGPYQEPQEPEPVTDG